MSVFGTFLEESYDFINEKVIYQGKELSTLIKAIIKELKKNHYIAKGKISDYHGTSMNLTCKKDVDEELWSKIKSVIKEQVDIYEKKFNCEYSWELKVSNKENILIVFDCDIK